jgi:hypothetical protein
MTWGSVEMAVSVFKLDKVDKRGDQASDEELGRWWPLD